MAVRQRRQQRGSRRSSFANIPLSNLDPQIADYLRQTGFVTTRPDGTEVALSNEAGEVFMLTDTPPPSLPGYELEEVTAAYVGEDVYELTAPEPERDPYVNFTQTGGRDDEDDLLAMTAQATANRDELVADLQQRSGPGGLQYGGIADQAMVALAGTAAAREAAMDEAASDIFRLSQQQQYDQLRAAGVRGLPTWKDQIQPRPQDSTGHSYNSVGLCSENVLEALSSPEVAEFSNVIPDATTSWYDPVRDGAGNDGRGFSNVAGDLTVALSRTAEHLGNAQAGIRRSAGEMTSGETDEVIRLTAAYSGEFPVHPLALAGRAPRAGDGDDDMDDYAYARRGTRTRQKLPGTIGPAEDEVNRLIDMGETNGTLAVRNAHGKAGNGHRVTSAQRAHHRDLERHGENDSDQPRKGGQAHPGVVGGIYDGEGIGGAEEISRRHPDILGRGKLADKSRFGQRSRGLAPSGHAPAATRQVSPDAYRS